MSGETVLVLRRDGEVFIDTPSFGHRAEWWMWNRAWVYEHYEKKSIGPEGRNWLGKVNERGIAQVRALGWDIEPAYVGLYKKQ